MATAKKAVKKRKAKKEFKSRGPTLNEKMRRFVEQYFVDFNMQAAAIRAGYSQTSAHVSASLLMKNPKVMALINERRKQYAQSIGVTAEWLMLRYKEIADADISEFLEEGNIADLSKIKNGKGRIVEAVKISNTEFDGGSKETITLKLYNKLSALEALGKHLGFFEADNKQAQTVIKVTLDD